jgi:hypothetical protein
MVALPNHDEQYLETILKAVGVCASYKPKFEQGRGGGYSLEDFRKLYGSDAFYSWFGLDNPLMYAAHKAAGGMTSIYRQIGIGCEQLFRRILQDALELSVDDSEWSYDIQISESRSRTLHLDGRIQVQNVKNAAARKRLRNWIEKAASSLGVAEPITRSLSGAVFEIRQGYKSKDSKRQNADIANAATAYTKTYFPCAIILSSQIDADILLRYRAEKWFVLTGTVGLDDPFRSTYDFMRAIVGYDLAAFFQRNSKTLKKEIDAVLKALLTPD